MNYKYINLDYIETISEGDAETKIQLIELFFDQVDEILQKFSTALEKNDVQQISTTAHLAKSSVKVMGINNIAEKMLELEQSAKQNINQNSYKQIIEYFRQNIPAALNELSQEIEQLKQK